jgi:uncharacterized protein (DUF2164 family)
MTQQSGVSGDDDQFLGKSLKNSGDKLIPPNSGELECERKRATDSISADDRAGVSGDGRDNNSCPVHEHYNFTCGTCNGLFDKNGNPITSTPSTERLREQIKDLMGEFEYSFESEQFLDEILRLIDAQYNQGLEAAESALPEKRAAKYGDGLGNNYYIRSEGFDDAIDAARRQIRDLRRGKEE